MVAAVLRTLTGLPEAPPPPPRNSRHLHASADGAGGATSPAETRREMVSSASQILHSAPSHLLAPLAEELVDVALHVHEELHEDGRLLLQRLEEPPRQKAARKVVRDLGAATGAAVASKAEPYAKLLEALYKGDPCMLHPHTEALVRLATGGLALGAEVASATLPALANDAAIFSKVVEQLQASGSEWQPTPVVRTLRLIGRLDAKELSCHEHARLFFQRCLLHPAPTVRRRPAPRKHAANVEHLGRPPSPTLTARLVCRCASPSRWRSSTRRAGQGRCSRRTPRCCSRRCRARQWTPPLPRTCGRVSGRASCVRWPGSARRHSRRTWPCFAASWSASTRRRCSSR